MGEFCEHRMGCYAHESGVRGPRCDLKRVLLAANEQLVSMDVSITTRSNPNDNRCEHGYDAASRTAYLRCFTTPSVCVKGKSWIGAEMCVKTRIVPTT